MPKLDDLINARYRLDAELGMGGMGTVYRAYDTLLHREVALKILHGSALNPDGHARLLNEAQAVAAAQPPQYCHGTRCRRDRW